MKILVVDDAHTVRWMLREMLEKVGHEVFEAENGLQAVDALQRHPDIRVIFLDWSMPEMDGMGFLRERRRTGLAAGARVIMLTANNRMEQIQQALESGAVEYIMKPFTEDVVLEKLEWTQTAL